MMNRILSTVLASAFALTTIGAGNPALASPLSGDDIGVEQLVPEKPTLQDSPADPQTTASTQPPVQNETGQIEQGGQAVTPRTEVRADQATLMTADMAITLRKGFPSVIEYTMTKLGNRVMHGQPTDLRTVTINGTDITLGDQDVTFSQPTPDKAVYVLSVKNAEKHIDAKLTVEVWAKANTLHMDITKIENAAGEENPIQTVALTGQNLVSVRSSQQGAQFTGARMSTNTTVSGDTSFPVTNATVVDPAKSDYVYGFVSADSLSAGLWSNSENDGTTAGSNTAGGGKNTRVVTTAQNVEGSTSFGLASPLWYYHRTVKDSKNRTYTVQETDMPKMAVSIAGDENNDGVVNWQDGAIAFRSIMNNPYKAEEVPDLVSWRIAMNFGGQAQNPFLTTLDNVKKVSLNTDGLGQSVLLKGYANEGHDSGHPDYGDIGKRIGGAKDMNALMKDGGKYGARFGVHVNADEMYPEAKAFNEDMVRRNSSGGLRYGWNWLDQAVGIDGIYDLASNSRQSRFGDLKNQVGDNMDFVYVDVWGNQTSGKEDSWETRKLSKMITDNGWRVANEWGAANEYDSTFQHWAADLTYGGAGLKGQNSEVMRFLRNHQKDSWDGDYPSYGGASNAPLLGGYSMKDFEGWQGRNDYDAYIDNLYTYDLTTKFMQHFKVVRWINNPLDGSAVQDAGVNGGNEQIELKDDQGNSLVVSRKSNDQSSAAYRDRTIIFNGKVVSTGDVSRGDGKGIGNESYLIPWLWDAQTGKVVKNADQKLYHWNTKGGTTTWTLPETWKGLSNVKVYRLTDQGKTDLVDLPVVNGQITVTAKARTPYVIHQGASADPEVNWSTGTHLVDVGFNAGSKSLQSYWKTQGDGTAQIAKSQFSNPMLKLDGNIQAGQTITGLTGGKRYALYVGVDNRSDGQATLEVSNGGKILGSNSTGRSIAKNYIQANAHNTNSATVDGSSYFQNMYVFFTAPSDGETKVALKHKGSGSVYFDDVRVVENSYEGVKTDKQGGVIKLANDFENNAQGIWPFVVSGAEGVEDNRVHLSELHAPYTQAGWDVKKMDDVLQGKWSIKINGLTEENTLIYQTIPQNIKFLAGNKYKISFDYQSGTTGSYALAVGHGEFNPSSVELHPLDKALGTTAHYEFDLSGGLKDDTWFGIYSTATAPDLQGTSGDVANFGGYQDFVLDNLQVEHRDSSARTKAEVQAKLDELSRKYGDKQAQYSDQAWLTYLETRTRAQILIDQNGASGPEFSQAYEMLDALDKYMQSAPGNEGSDKYDIASDQYSVIAGSEQSNVGNTEGPKEFAQDGKESTYWHTRWGSNAITSGEGWYQFNLNNPTTVTGLRYLPRPGGANSNGKIKKYRIVLTTSNGTVKNLTQDNDPNGQTGEFDTVTRWQKAAFEPVPDVVKVRLVAIETAGRTAGEANQFVSAAELRLTTDRNVPAPKEPVDKTGLQEVVTAARGLDKTAFTESSWQNLDKQLSQAQAILDDSNASAYQVGLALANLNKAIDDLQSVVKPGPAQVDKSALKALIDKVKALNLAEYSNDSVRVLNTALAKANLVMVDSAASKDQVSAAAAELQSALDGLKRIQVTPSGGKQQSNASQSKGQDPAKSGQREGKGGLSDTGTDLVPPLVIAFAVSLLGLGTLMSIRRRHV